MLDPEPESIGDVENGPFFTSLAKYQEKKKILVAGHQNGSILFYNLLGPSPTLIAVTQVANYPISHLSLTEDGELLFCGDTNGNIYILDLFDFSFELSHTQVRTVRIVLYLDIISTCGPFLIIIIIRWHQ